MIPPKAQARPAEAPARLTTGTASAPTQEEACKRAQVMAMDYGTPGECACKIRGASNICQVQSSGPKPAFSVINALRKEIRERFGCKPEDKDCKRKPAVSMGGIR